ncbi:hypothetical protein CXG81DRAFT_13863 [Caulochytrium protostelioides]|uniref:Translation initiation factor eIF2B subunit delta n=1 Tax=Caulochytrium protostelioides TaxID=1555241 RepID=A0A4P9X4A9_9FUNG|nr:hypothetical protein CXG81DRAFT_13863 [Caulochytrium protostelioides]|eukprot:RKO99906.1 hypothetical protein CXG81DRAFT_13863 [Caulochytrium protostelioides]
MKWTTIHPAVLNLGLQYAEWGIAGGNARCTAMLNTFARVIADYTTPPHQTLSRHLTSVVSRHVDFLNTTRALSTSMKAAVRFLKHEISVLSPDLPDEDAKAGLIAQMRSFVEAKIDFADKAIVKETLDKGKIRPGDVILTYGFSSVVNKLLLKAHARKIPFRVVVADARPKFEGQRLLASLVAAGIPCSYCLLTAVPSLTAPRPTKVILGASAVLANGSIMSRAGTASVALLARMARAPVIVCAENYKFTETLRLDAFVWNELGDSEELSAAAATMPVTSTGGHVSVLHNWRDIASLKLLNLHYDITPAEDVTLIISESGFIPPSSAYMVFKEIEQNVSLA